ncbi:ABC transporter permease [Xanthomonas translucens]|uniref:ABC transporter permease n=1 Tax=Xanthomonas campestris pv. translucens TaxID=343 RepID=UPI0006423722|nr:FtsX-like permease family protein [Xanthomonas translucens]AKK69022.1 ABC transporter permease [Xanthomonas translucens pv. undulosa]AVY67980.1 ABC transporter permease [Xanthomonas translucens pv. undulosa]MCT8269225.1 ABC transporter permease [Xanthomonas translucens pv. undulosa]QEO27731.1 FtsX-like permease family protein [Xanthomonas translucens pv. undulosa]UPU49989.1 ABC transporter permease [Xanthomonas translucens pv. undulosa]
MDIRPILSTLRRHKTAAALIVLEIALACAIVCNALFLIGNRIETLHRPSGIAESELVTISLGGIGQQVNAAARTREDLAALRAVPGVRNATVLNQVPFVHYSWNTSLALTPDQERPTLNAAQYMAEEGTLQTLGLQLVAGRDFTPDEYLDLEIAQTDRDAQKKGTAIILNRATAEKMFPGQNALGKTLYTGPIPVRVVGIVDTLARPAATSSLAEIDYAMLLPLRLNYTKGLYVLRVTDPARRQEVLTAATAALMKEDNSRLVLKQQTYTEIRDDYFQGDRAMVWLLGAVCIALLIVTALGIVGLASFWVQQRTRQIGIRRALGATRGQILRYFQTENFLLASTGIVLGMLLAYAINQWLMGKYELPRLPLYYLPFGALTLWLLGQIAVFAPARRAAAVPPAVATRSA